MKKSNNPNTVKWLIRSVGRRWVSIAALAALVGISSAVSVAYAWLFRSMIDSAVARDAETFKRSVLFLLALLAGQITVNTLIRYLSEDCQSAIENRLKQGLFRCLLTRDYALVTTVHSGEWMNRLTSDTRVVASNLVSILPELTGMIVRLVGAVALLIALQPELMLVLLPLGIGLILVSFLFRKTLKKLHKKIQEKDGALRIFLQERLSSMMILRVFGQEQQTAEESAVYMKEHKAARMKRNNFSNLANIGFGLVMHGAYIGSAIYCSVGIFRGTVSFGTLTAVMSLVSQVQGPFANISGLLPRYYSMTASAERLMEAEAFPEEVPGRPLAEVQEFYDSRMEAIGLEGVSYAYYPPSASPEGISKEDVPDTVRDINIRIGKGEYVAFTGQSGCGKSTVLKLLMGVYAPDKGQRYALDSDGSKMELDGSWRRLFAYVPQSNLLISGTIREVVCFGDAGKTADPERIRRALRVSCAEEFVDSMENGLDTLLGERGSGLSEGQMQRLAIARAIFSESPVLLLDEATSALDSATEQKLLENLKELTDRTVVIITHRPAALSICDRILKFTEGGVIEA